MDGTAVLDEMVKALEVVVEIILHRHQQRSLIESDAPVQIAGEASQLKRTVDIARDETQPPAGLYADDNGTPRFQQHDRTIEQLLVTRYHDGALGSAVSLRPQAMTLRVCTAQRDELDIAMVFEMMQTMPHVVVVGVAKDLFQLQHDF
jgi:hypothetical protein